MKVVKNHSYYTASTIYIHFLSNTDKTDYLGEPALFCGLYIRTYLVKEGTHSLRIYIVTP